MTRIFNDENEPFWRSAKQIELDLIPRLDAFDALAPELELDAMTTLVSGGEDYELLFTAPLTAQVESWATRIGLMRSGSGTVGLVDRAGNPIHTPIAGFDHFR